MTAEQKAKLSAAQKAYVASDPRWPEHRNKLSEAQTKRRMTLFPDEITAIVALRKKGRSFSYIEAEIGICRDIMRRELNAQGIATAPIRPRRRVVRGRGFWRSFDEA